MTQVVADPVEDDGRQLHLSHDRVASSAEQAADVARCVVVVDDQVARRRVAEQAASVLHLAHLADLVRREVVLPTEPRAKVLLAGRLRVLSPPLSQPLVPPLTVRSPVVAVPTTDALAALAALQPPLREVAARQCSAARSTRGHDLILPRDTSTRSLDRPCHADVLLELANAGAGA